MLTTSPAHNNLEKGYIISLLIEHWKDNQLIIGDIHAPMNKLSDVFKIVENNEIVSGWTIFKGFENPVIVFPPNMIRSWDLIRNFISGLKYEKILVSFPKITTENHKSSPWDNWPEYEWKELFIDKAMILSKTELEVMDIEALPPIRGIGIDHEDIAVEFFSKVKLDTDYQGFFHPFQLESDLYVVCEDDGKIIASAGSHFETPVNIQIGNVYVLPEYRKKGIGKALTTAVTLGIIKSNRFPTLFVNQENEKAINIYKSMGFEEYNEFVFYEGTKVM